MRVRAPRPIASGDDFNDFCSGSPALDAWLKERACDAQTRLTKTFVIKTENRVVGYYALNFGSVILPVTVTVAGQPDIIPAMILGRLVVDRGYQGQGLGAALLRDALLRILQVRQVIDVRLVVALAVAPPLHKFFAHYGFQAIPTVPHASYLPIHAISQAAVAGLEALF